MPTYTEVNTAGAIDDLASQNLPPDQILKKVQELLTLHTKNAMANQKLYQEDITTQQAQCKATIDRMEKGLQKIKDDPTSAILDITLVPTIEAGLTIIDIQNKSVHKSGVDFMAANAGYRGAWPDAARKKLNVPEDRLKTYTGLREKTINDNKANVAISKRVAEYVERAKTIIAEAKALAGKGAASTRELVGQLTELHKKIEAACKKISEDVYKDMGKVKTVNGFTKLPTIDSKLWQSTEGSIKHLEAGRKNLKGALKTVKGQVELVDKLIKGSKGPIMGNPAEKVKVLYAKAEKDVQGFEKEVDDVLKLVPALKKKVK